MTTLESNTADEAGSAVYGGSLDECFLQTRSHQSVLVYSGTGTYIFSSILQIIDNSFSPVSQVSSNPVAVRVCNHKVLPIVVECILDSCLRFQ